MPCTAWLALVDRIDPNLQAAPVGAEIAWIGGVQAEGGARGMRALRIYSLQLSTPGLNTMEFSLRRLQPLAS